MSHPAAAIVLGFALLDQEHSFAAAAVSDACPAVEQRSLSACSRCIHDDLCPMGENNTYMVCDPYIKKCVHPSWSATKVSAECPEDANDPTTWGAWCKLACYEQQSPFACATNQCLNEDFPCNWVDGCSPPKGVMSMSSACKRSCLDHEDKLNYLYSVKECSTAIAKFGCRGSWHQIDHFCPVSCGSMECSWRCGRDEEPNILGRRCYERVEEDGLSCLDAIREGQDCNCKCAHYYKQLSGTYTRPNGGAFQVIDKIGTEAVGLRASAIAGREFTLDFTGEGMRDADVGNVDGPRMKVIQQGGICSDSPLPLNLTGLVCVVPQGSNLLAAVVCTTPPNRATQFLHRWRAITLNECGDYQLCHCNGNCDIGTNWKRAGELEVRPVMNWGTMSQPLPGCAAYLPTLAPEGTAAEYNETYQAAQVRAYFSISGGLIPWPNVLRAVRSALAGFLSSYSDLLGAVVPELDDVTIEDVEQAGIRRLRGRRAQGVICADDDEAFALKASQANLAVGSCQEAFNLLGDVEKLCADATLQEAVQEGCQLTCGLCAPSTTSTAAPTPLVSAGENNETITWEGGSDALKIVAKVRTYTDLSAERMISRLESLFSDPQQFLQSLYVELEKEGLKGADIPGQMWAYLAQGPFLELEPTTTTTTPPPPTWTTGGWIWAIVGGVAGGLCLLSCCVGAALIYCNREKVETEDKEVIEVSEGGYRSKKKIIPGQKAPPPKPSIFKRCWEASPCVRYLCPKREIRRVAPVTQEMTETNPGEIYTGVRVRLHSLSQAHYNGLEGFVSGGPNEKGRYFVDVLLDDDERVRETQTVSFRPENMKVIPPEWAVDTETETTATIDIGSRVAPGSYRSGK